MRLQTRRRRASRTADAAPAQGWHLGEAVRRPETIAAASTVAFVTLAVAATVDASSGSGVSVLALVTISVAAGLLGGLWAELLRDAPPVDSPSLHRLLALSAGSLLVLAAVYLLAQRTTHGQRFERDVLLGSDESVFRLHDEANTILDQLTVGTVLLVGAAACALAVVRRRLPLALAVGASILLTVCSAAALKHLLLDRPQLLGGDALATVTSYPSGHVAAIAALCAGVVVAAPSQWRVPATIGAAAATAVFGICVLAVGWHRPSDAIGGVALALGWFGAVGAILVRARDRDVLAGVGATRAVPPRLWFLGAYILAAGAVCFAIAEIARLQAEVDQPPEHHAAFFAGVLLFVAADVLGFAALSAALPRSIDEPSTRGLASTKAMTALEESAG